MPYQIVIKRSAEKELNALPSALRNRIANRLLALEENPPTAGGDLRHRASPRSLSLSED